MQACDGFAHLCLSCPQQQPAYTCPPMQAFGRPLLGQALIAFGTTRLWVQV